MKTFVVLVSVLVATVLAQFPEGFPPCGVTCVTNMLGQAAALGCPGAPNATCLCTNINFGYGIRDCSVQYCQDMNLANQVISFGNAYCSSAGVIISAPPATASVTVVAPSTTNTLTITGAPAPVSTAPIVTTITGADGSTTVSTIGSTTLFAPGTGPVIGGGAVTVSPIVTTVTGADGSTTVSTIGSTTIPLTGFVTSVPVSTVPIVSTEVINGTTNIQTIGTSTILSVATTARGVSSTSTSSGLAAAKTAAPAGLLAAAGIAALFL